MRWFSSLLLALFVVCFAGAAARADDSGKPAPYAEFIKGATVQNGLFNVWRKDGKVYLEV